MADDSAIASFLKIKKNGVTIRNSIAGTAKIRLEIGRRIIPIKIRKVMVCKIVQ